MFIANKTHKWLEKGKEEKNKFIGEALKNRPKVRKEFQERTKTERKPRQAEKEQEQNKEA